jgi:hypothetical protein
MQKKLYFLNEEEKNRILNLHESATKKQYLLEGQRSDMSTANKGYIQKRDTKFETINYECNIDKYTDVTPTLDKEYLVQQIKYLSTNWSFHIGPEAAAALKNIFTKQMLTIGDYCAVDKKYVEKYGKHISYDVNYAFYENTAWEDSFFNPVNNLLKKSKTTPPPNTPEQPKETGGLMKGIVSKHRETMKQTPSTTQQEPSTQTQQPPSGIRITRSVQAEIPTLLQSAGIKDAQLNQTNLTQLYNILSKK